MNRKEIVALKRHKEMCPECHKRTLVLRTIRSSDERNPLQVNRNRVARCENCSYSSLKILR